MCHFPMIFAQWKRMYKEHFTEGWNIVICQTFEADHASRSNFIQQRGWLKNKIIGYIIFRGWKTIATKGIGNIHALRQQVWHISNSFVLSGVDVNTSYMCVTSITHVHNDITKVVFNYILIFVLISIINTDGIMKYDSEELLHFVSVITNINLFAYTQGYCAWKQQIWLWNLFLNLFGRTYNNDFTLFESVPTKGVNVLIKKQMLAHILSLMKLPAIF